MITEIWTRIVRNWKTSSVAIVALVVLVAGWCGFDITGTQITTLFVGLEALVLLFAKD